MKATLRSGLIAVALALAGWAWFSWPLPLHVTTGIPHSSRDSEQPPVRRMVPGDHLQLLYHFWLAADMARGHTPWMRNPYEFNTGEDLRCEPSEYYFPFSAVFALGDAIGGRALGWNLTGALSLLLTLLLTWQLARRYVDRSDLALAGSVISIVLPYRWISLLGGSPTGFDMVLVPMLWLGLDIAIRDHRARGGLLAGLATCFAAGSDPHVFFFSILSLPAWCIVAFTASRAAVPTPPLQLAAKARALAPLAVLGLGTLALTMKRSQALATTDMEGGWGMRELARFSPQPHGLWSWAADGIGDQIFIGVALPALLTIGGVLILWRLVTATPRRPLACWLLPALLAGGAVGVVLLGLGPNGPFDGKLVEACRALVPPYRMIRQSAKIFCLLPTLLALLAALSLAALSAGRRPRVGTAIGLLALAVALFEFRSQFRPGISLLDTQQGAYEAVAAKAVREGITARALGIPLWPGQSHWASLNMHYASLFHIRMVNGYRPAVPEHYVEEVFEAFSSFNLGACTDAQLDRLRTLGIDCLLFHEDAFPPQVSPFPAGITLQRLLANPRLTRLAHDGGIWAFQIQPSATPPAALPDPRAALYGPSLQWSFERLRADGGSVITDDSADAGGALRLEAPGASVKVACRTPISPYPELRFLVRVRGHGTLRTNTGDANAISALEIQSPDWSWIAVALTNAGPTFFTPAVRFDLDRGAVDLDTALLAAGTWEPMAVGESRLLHLPLFFHGGHRSTDGSAVAFTTDASPSHRALYGPGLPLDPGTYSLTLETQSAGLPGTRLGTLTVAGRPEAATEVIAGRPATVRVTWPDNRPFTVEFHYAHRTDMQLRRLTLTRE